MNKRLLLVIFILISFFSVFEIAKAEEIKTLDLTEIFDEFKAFNYEIWNTKNGTKVSYKSELDRLIANLDNLNVKYMIAYSDFNTRKNLQEHNGISQFYFTIYIFNSDSVTLINESGDGLFYFEKEHNQVRTYTSRYAYFIEKDLKVLSDYIEQNNSLPTENLLWKEGSYSGGIYKSTTPFAPTLKSDDNSGTFIYRTNVNLKFESTQYDIMKVGSNVYNSQVPVYDRIKDYGKIVYSFNESISTNGISQVRFKFDVPERTPFVFDFNYSVSFSKDSAILSPPSVEYKTQDSEGIQHLYSLPLYHRTAIDDEIVYNNTEKNQFQSVTSFEFVVDFTNKRDLNETVRIFFESEYSFSVEYVTESFYQEVDFSGNYGILLIPRKIDLSTSNTQRLLSPIYYKGAPLFWGFYADIKDTSNFTLSYLTKKTDIFQPFAELFGVDKMNETLFIIYEDYVSIPDTTIIKYDTRYFNYAICKNKDSCDKVVNPNTNEEITPKPPTILTQESDDFFSGLLKRFMDPIHEKMPIIKQIPEVFEIFSIASSNPKAPDWKVDLSGIGINKVVYMDFYFFDQHRNTIFFIIQLSATYVTIRKLLDIIARYFN